MKKIVIMLILLAGAYVLAECSECEQETGKQEFINNCIAYENGVGFTVSSSVEFCQCFADLVEPYVINDTFTEEIASMAIDTCFEKLVREEHL